MEEIKVEAELAQLDKVIQFINTKLAENSCVMKEQMQIDVAVEEIYVNIARYAYPDKNGTCVIQFSFDCETGIAVIRFIDSGIPYNPLARKEPDTTLSAEERSIGGLGIFMVKKTMDSMAYEYKDGCNILTMQKSCR